MEIVRQRILVVDDDPVISDIIKEALSGSGFEVAVAENGQQALDMISGYAPHAIVLDRRMPVMDGNEMLRRLKANEDMKSIPVIMLTGDHEIEQVMESLELGANEYVVKPVVPGDMVIRLKVMLKTGGIKRKEKKNFEGFEGNSSGW